MKYQHHHPPAESPYSPPIRALCAPCNNPSHGHKKTNTYRNGIIILYLVLKFWDRPLLQTTLRRILSQWNASCETNPIVKTLIQSNVGKFTGGMGKKFMLFFIKCLMKAVQVTKADKAGFLVIPQDIQQWTKMNTNDNVNASVNIREMRIVNSAAHSQNHQYDKRIDRVLKYWFGRSNPEKSQKQLWMIAASSTEHRQKIDAEIYEAFGSLLLELGCNPDTRKAWCNCDHGHNWRGALAAIIVLDQISRHVHRHIATVTIEEKDKLQLTRLPEQKYLDGIAHGVATDFQTLYADEISCGMVPTPMMIFALMPLRHKSTLQSVGFVQSKVEEMANLHSLDMDNMIRRFRKATNRRMAVLQDEARREGRETIYNAGTDSIMSAIEREEKNGDGKHLDSKLMEFQDDDILEFHHFEADMSDAKKNQVVKTMTQYLVARGLQTLSSSNHGNAKVPRDSAVIVSLSGGVDSMVIANVLAYLRDHGDFPQLYIVAVHIDYGNRPESAAEAAYVKHYALNILKLDRCIVRRIDEVTRGVTKRDEYEKFSRNVRYDLYRETVKKCILACSENNPNCVRSEVGVMLGHHRGDVVENVISNSNKGCGPLDLSGMTSLSQNDGVTIYRPLLPLQKTDVFAYSHKYGIPYFKDTTPHWSTRGKLRNKLIPILEEVYGDGCLSNLASLAEESDEARDLFNESALKPFMQKVQQFPMGIMFSTDEFRNQGTYFWKIVLRDMLHSVGLGMFSVKSTESFLKRILPKKVTSGWLQCRRDYGVYLMEDRRVLVLYPDSFPWRKSDHYNDSVGTVVPYGEMVTVGPWEISVKITPDDKMKPVFNTWDEFMSGNIQYCINVPSHSGQDLLPLEIVDTFTKQSRPPSWKGMDLKLQSTLPLLGHGKEALADWDERTPTTLATVYLKLRKCI